MPELRHRALGALLLAACSASGFAQVRLKPEAPPATAEARRDCLAEQRTLADRRRAWSAAARQHGEDAEALAASGRELDAQRARLDPVDVRTLEVFNTRNAERNLRVEAHNARLAELERERSVIDADEAALRQRCSGRAFPAARAASAAR